MARTGDREERGDFSFQESFQSGEICWLRKTLVHEKYLAFNQYYGYGDILEQMYLS